MAKLKQKETDIQRQICKYLEARGFTFWRQNNMGTFRDGRYATSRFGMKGIPDIFLLLGTYTLAIEVKSATGRQSPEQKHFEKVWTSEYRLYFLVRSLDDAMEITNGELG